MERDYLERTAEDLRLRVSSLILNNQTVGIEKVERLGSIVSVTTAPVRGIQKVSSVKLLDEKGGLITERLTNLQVIDEQILRFAFSFEVKGG